ncbi:MAG: PHP domain-containing protein [Treponema sp.]|nr:PHP domain-containing protein [Treponema sp.]
MSYLYETHLHTAGVSACANSRGSEYIPYYMDLGYSGIIVTDHFYNGNTAIPRGLPWKEWVKRFCRGYEEARNEGERHGFDVFFGWEETFDGCDDYLVFGLDKAWLLEHPEVRKWSRGEQYRTVRAAGGCVVQAHPFRQHYYIRQVVLSAGCVDAVEAANAANCDRSYDALAARYGQKLGLPLTAGSDMHDVRQIYSNGVFGVFLEEKINAIGDFVRIIRDNGIAGISVSKGRCDFRGDEKVTLPVEVRDSSDRSTGEDWKNLLK